MSFIAFSFKSFMTGKQALPKPPTRPEILETEGTPAPAGARKAQESGSEDEKQKEKEKEREEEKEKEKEKEERASERASVFKIRSSSCAP